MLAVPNDYSMVLGDPLPSSLLSGSSYMNCLCRYFLIFSGILSSKLPQALAKGEWLDKYQPLVDTVEYRQLLSDLSDYRQRALGLIARHLPPYFRNKRILCKAFWENLQNRRSSDPGWTRRCHFFLHRLEDLIRWNINSRNIAQEMQRQRVSKVDFKFCLAWHTNEYLNGGPLIKDLNRRIPEDEKGDDTKAVSAIVHFMLLEHLGLIADDGGMTVLGDVLKDSPTYLQEPCLVALELMKFGLLSGDPFEAAERPFPEQVGYPKQSVDGTTKSILLLARAMSLVPMKLKSGMWNADVDFDLAAFHSLVRLVKRALRHLAEASLVSVLLKNLQRVNLLPQVLIFERSLTQLACPTRTFMLPRACMGIVCLACSNQRPNAPRCLFFLKFQGSFKSFTRELYAKFPCCIQPLEDLSTAFRFWEELADDMEAAVHKRLRLIPIGMAYRSKQALGAPEAGAWSIRLSGSDLEDLEEFCLDDLLNVPLRHNPDYRLQVCLGPDTLFLSPFVGNCQIIDRLMRTGTIKPKILYLPINPLAKSPVAAIPHMIVA
ncbi:unnamed protein product [Symbiodinium microadriaticum]|nr:unnamed protein product [Symbiodinium microadriaticum]